MDQAGDVVNGLSTDELRLDANLRKYIADEMNYLRVSGDGALRICRGGRVGWQRETVRVGMGRFPAPSLYFFLAAIYVGRGGRPRRPALSSVAFPHLLKRDSGWFLHCG